MNAWLQLQNDAAIERDLTNRIDKMRDAARHVEAAFSRCWDCGDNEAADRLDTILDRLERAADRLTGQLPRFDYPLH